MLKYIIKLAKSVAFRHANSEAVVYGEHLVIEALNCGVLRRIFVKTDKLTKYAELLFRVAEENIYVIDEICLHKIGISDSMSDVVAIIETKSGELNKSIYQNDCVVLDSIQDPGNLGTIMRSCASSGINNLILSKGCVDPYNIKVIRASQGTQFRLNIILGVDLPTFLLNYCGIIWATAMVTNRTIYQCDLKETGAWIFGNEGAGLPNTILKDPKVNVVSIPMHDHVESLNVAMAATVCLFETMRQRSIAK